VIERKEYLENLIQFKDKELIKVITGVRRCGKSTLFELYKEYLLNNGIGKEQIISLNLEDPQYYFLDNYMKLYNYILERLNPEKKNYIFIDEVQNVPQFQKACDGLYINKNVDLYITGSNAFLLSGELATLLSGRYIEIKMLPLSFKEYVNTFDNKENLERLYASYITRSSFPYALQLEQERDVEQYLKGIYDSIVLKDIVARKKFPDLTMLQSVMNFMMDNIGNLTSTNKIAATLNSTGRNISVHTVENYINALLESYIFYKATRYDIKGKQYLKTGDKYYITDLALRYYLLGKKQGDTGHILENIVYLELLRRGYDVYVGKNDETEVDFIANGPEGTEYYQVAVTIREEKTFKREISALDNIKDHNPKYLLTLDIEPKTSYNGIKQINVLDWLLE